MLRVDKTSIETRKEAGELLLEGIKAKMGLIRLGEWMSESVGCRYGII